MHLYELCLDMVITFVFYIETWLIFQVLFLIVMTSTEEECNFPDTLQGFGYAFNKGKGKIDFWKIKQICSYLRWTMGKIMLYELKSILFSQSSDHFLKARNNKT
jgi:hypothetical protein